MQFFETIFLEEADVFVASLDMKTPAKGILQCSYC